MSVPTECPGTNAGLESEDPCQICNGRAAHFLSVLHRSFPSIISKMSCMHGTEAVDASDVDANMLFNAANRIADCVQSRKKEALSNTVPGDDGGHNEGNLGSDSALDEDTSSQEPQNSPLRFKRFGKVA